MTKRVLHLSLLTEAFGPENTPLAIPAAVVFDGELGALGDGPFRIGRIGTWPCSWASRNSPWRSPELKRLFRKLTPVEKLSRKLENEILAVWKNKSKKNYMYIQPGRGVGSIGCWEPSLSCCVDNSSNLLVSCLQEFVKNPGRRLPEKKKTEIFRKLARFFR